ncbi:MAG: tetratricopeptide repeat protein [Bacteroidales bacterium]
MKTITNRIILIIVSLLLTSTAFAQKGIEDGSKYGHGEDSIRCIKNLSLYREYFKQGSMKYAEDHWKIVYNECPKATKRVFLDGEDILLAAINRAEEKEIKSQMVDSLMRLYDRRIKYYGQKEYVLARKGITFIRESENTLENMERGYDMLGEAIEAGKKGTAPAALITYMQTSKVLFSANKIEGTQVVGDFSKVSDIIDFQLTKKPENAQLQKVKSAIDQVFETSGAANCKDLINLYEPKFANNKEDAEWLNKVYTLLDKTGCIDSEFYFTTATQLNTIEPSAELAHELARIKADKEKYEEAARYYKQAIELQNDNKKKASYYLELGDITYRKLGNHSQARTYALNAAELVENNGRAYMLIGHIYASTKSCGEDELGKAAIYWVAVDKFAKAKALDENLTDEANKYIQAYSQYFPDNETIFFHGFKEGDAYTVGCWINEKTTVRSR